MQNIHARGFTLIELLVVISIIGLLSSVILTSLNVAREKGNDATRKTNLTEIQKALQSYYDDTGKYPGATATNSYNVGGSGHGYASQCSVGGAIATNSLIPSLISGGYISQLPSDSETNVAGNNCCYEYFVSITGADYKFSFYKGTAPTGGCAVSAAGTSGGPIDTARAGAWAVYSPGGSAL